MPTFAYESTVRAPLDRVWAFHASPDGLLALTPAWLGLSIDAITAPDGTRDPDELRPGTTIELSVSPFGLLPGGRAATEIVEWDVEENRARFVDELCDGPFESWVHEHQFVAADEETICRDSIAYELPFGRLGRLVEPLVSFGLAAGFRYRHWKLRRRLE